MGRELGEIRQEAVQSLSPSGKGRGSGVYTCSNLPFGREEGEGKQETERKVGRKKGGKKEEREGTPGIAAVLGQLLCCPGRTGNTLGPSTWKFCLAGSGVEGAAPEALP